MPRIDELSEADSPSCSETCKFNDLNEFSATSETWDMLTKKFTAVVLHFGGNGFMGSLLESEKLPHVKLKVVVLRIGKH